MAELTAGSRILLEKVRSPAGIILGSPGAAAHLAGELPAGDLTCYQMDLYQAERLSERLQQADIKAQVMAVSDLWDLPPAFQTLIYPVARRGERSLKLDMIEQAFHVLRERGTLIVLSPYEADSLFPIALKKVFKHFHLVTIEEGNGFWCVRHGTKTRRRHECTFHVRMNDQLSLSLVSRPGVFSYGRFDEGSRALVETMQVQPGDRILDLGCGCGANGIYAAHKAGPEGSVVFVDSNLRAVQLAEQNAVANGVTNFRTLASPHMEGLAPKSFDIVLANPPYYAQSAIAQLFVEKTLPLLRPGGHFYLVTKKPREMEPIVCQTFRSVDVSIHRGYHIFDAQTSSQ